MRGWVTPEPEYVECRQHFDAKYGLNVFFLRRGPNHQWPSDPQPVLGELLREISLRKARQNLTGMSVLLGDGYSDPWMDRAHLYFRPSPDSEHDFFERTARRWLTSVFLGPRLFYDWRQELITNEGEFTHRGEGNLRFRVCSALEAYPRDDDAVYCVTGSGFYEPREQIVNFAFINDKQKGVRICTPELDSGWLHERKQIEHFSTPTFRFSLLELL
jgi:hypothetical protein